MTIDVESVMSRVRLEVSRRRRRAEPAQQVSAGIPSAWGGALAPIPYKDEYKLEELLVYADRAFVENAYLAVLRRSPDPGGLASHLDKLRSGEATKVEILAHLRWSAEGVERSVHVDGLLVPYTLQRWRRKRFIGPIVSWLHALARLGSMSERIQMSEVVQARDTTCLAEHVDGVSRHLGARSLALDLESDRIDQQVRQLAGAFESDAETTRSQLQLLEARIDEAEAGTQALSGRIIETQAGVEALDGRLVDSRSSIQALDQEIARLRAIHEVHVDQVQSLALDVRRRSDELDQALLQGTERIERLSSLLAAMEAQDAALRQTVGDLQGSLLAKESLLADHSHHLAAQGHALAMIEQARTVHQRLERSLDPLYVAFEDKFRGSPELIRERAMPYLDLIRDAQVGTPRTPILDIGCGRGNWLDILKEQGLVATGVDTNEVFVAICRSRNLDVVAGDALEYLRTLPDGSLGGITGMHIAEHLPFETLIELLDQCRRVLCVGGLLALETPNPENLTVASLNFYMDPTHRNPLPPETFRWIVEARGFQNVNIHRWTIARDMAAPPLVDDGVPGAASMNVLLSQLHAAPDYAIVARRLQ